MFPYSKSSLLKALRFFSYQVFLCGKGLAHFYVSRVSKHIKVSLLKKKKSKIEKMVSVPKTVSERCILLRNSV